MLVVDTNVAAYFLIQGDQSAVAHQLHQRDRDWRSEAFLLIEFTNVLASSVARRRMTLPLAQEFFGRVQNLFEGKLTRVAHATVLATAIRYGITAYDARFLTLADQLGRPLVTEDARLRAAAPELTQSIAEALAAA